MEYKNFSPKQLMAMTWWNRPGTKAYDAIICDGAVRSGKTVCMADGFFLWSMLSFHDTAFALCGRSIGALHRNIVSNLSQWLGSAFTVRYMRSQNALTVTAGGHRNT